MLTFCAVKIRKRKPTLLEHGFIYCSDKNKQMYFLWRSYLRLLGSVIKQERNKKKGG